MNQYEDDEDELEVEAQADEQDDDGDPIELQASGTLSELQAFAERHPGRRIQCRQARITWSTGSFDLET